MIKVGELRRWTVSNTKHFGQKFLVKSVRPDLFMKDSNFAFHEHYQVADVVFENGDQDHFFARLIPECSELI